MYWETAETPTEIRARRALRFQYTEIKAFIGACFGQLKPASFTNMSTRTSVANYQMTKGEEVCYSKGRQCYLFWGLIPLGRTRVSPPPDRVCEVRTRYGFWDAFVSLITCGIFEMQQIRVYTKKPAKATITAASPSSPTHTESSDSPQPWVRGS